MSFQPDDILSLDQPTAGLCAGWYLYFHSDQETTLLAVTTLEKSGEVTVTDRMVRVQTGDLSAFRLIGTLVEAET
jgi:hypothetical protein